MADPSPDAPFPSADGQGLPSNLMSDEAISPPAGRERRINLKYEERMSVVKIFSIYSAPNWYYPWQNSYQRRSTSSGFIVQYNNERLVICNAHGIKFASSLRVRKNGCAKKFLATLFHVSHEADLALLKIDNADFWDGLQPLPFGGLPELQSEVIVLGYPRGGDALSITKGVVSRIEVVKYSHSLAYLPAVQTDAAINSGNSGGPALLDGRVVGVAFSNLSNSQNIGYVIPTCVIEYFLKNVLIEGDFCGFGQIGFSLQHLENECLRRYLKIGDRSGVIVRKRDPLSHCGKVLQKNDAILEIDGRSLGNDGTMELRESERVSWLWFIALKKPRTLAKIKLLRDGEEIEIDVEIYPLDKSVCYVPRHLHDRKPCYFVWGGLVISHLSYPLLTGAYGRDWRHSVPGNMKEKASKCWREKEGEEVVVLIQILDHAINLNYDSLGWDIIEQVNGEEVLNVADCFSKVVNAKEEFVKINLSKHGTLVLDRKKACLAAKDLQEEHKMFELVSEDLQNVPGAEKYLAWTRTRQEMIDIQSKSRNKVATKVLENDTSKLPEVDSGSTKLEETEVKESSHLNAKSGEVVYLQPVTIVDKEVPFDELKKGKSQEAPKEEKLSISNTPD